MKNWNTIPIPQLMLDHCERDPRGLPVPYVVLKDEHGKHHFKINDGQKSFYCTTGSLCTICGTKMEKDNQWLVGGIASAFDENGVYIDLPIHKECGTYALQVCPYLAMRGYNGKIDMDKLNEYFEGKIKLVNPTVDQDKLPLFVFMRPPQIQYLFDGIDFRIAPVRPALEYEFWHEGQQITDFQTVKDKLFATKWQKYLKDIARDTKLLFHYE